MHLAHIAGVGSAFPRHYYEQDVLLAALRQAWSRQHYNADRLDTIHRNVLVGGRHLALPLEEYSRLGSWGAANDAWVRVARAAVRIGGAADPGPTDLHVGGEVRRRRLLYGTKPARPEGRTTWAQLPSGPLCVKRT